MRVTCLLACVFAVALAAVPRAADFEHPLTLSEALQMLRSRNPALLSARAHVEATRASELTAALRPNPVLTSANEDFRVFTPSRLDVTGSQEFTQNISQLLERGGKRGSRVETARWSTTLAGETLLDTQRQMEFTLKSNFVALLLAKSNLEFARQNLADYAQTVKLNEIRLKAGDISPTEMDRLRGQEADFQSDLLNSQLAVVQARTSLQALLGVSDLVTPLDVQGSLDVPDVAVTLDDLQKAALANRPDYLGARDGISKAAADVRLADANGASDLVVGGEYKRNGFDNTIGFTFSVPIRLFDRNQGERQRTRLEVDASRANEQAVRAQVLADVAQGYENYRISLERVRIYSAEYLARARTVHDRTEFSYRQRATTLLDLLDAVRNYRAIELASRSANAAALTAIHQLSFVTGTELTK